MTLNDLHLFLHTISAFIVSIVSISYVYRWQNGKAVLGGASFVVFLYLAWAHGNAFLHNFDRATYGAMYIRPILHLVYLFGAVHFTIDWMKNILNLVTLAIESKQPSVKLNKIEKFALLFYLKVNKKELGIKLE